MTPAIRLGDRTVRMRRPRPPASPRIRRERLTLGGIATRTLSCEGSGVPAVLLHGWTDNADTWLDVLDRLALAGRPAIAYDLPGFGAAPPLDGGPVLDQLTEFADAAVRRAAAAAGTDVVVCGNSLGGWVALRLAERESLPLAGTVLLGPAGIRMARLFFAADRIPAVAALIGLPAPVPAAVVRGVAGQLFRRFGISRPDAVESAVVDRYARFMSDRATIAERIGYAKRLGSELDHPFDPGRIRVPVIAIWGDTDRLCPPGGAEDLARMLPEARIEVVPGCGHLPQAECPDLVVEAITELAGERDRRRAGGPRQRQPGKP